MPPTRVLICEKDPNLRGLLSLSLMRNGVEFDLAHDGVEAIGLLDTKAYGIIVLDLALPLLDGHALLLVIARMPRPRPVVIVSVQGPERIDVDPHIVTCILRKPHGIPHLLGIITEVAARLDPAAYEAPIDRVETDTSEHAE